MSYTDPNKMLLWSRFLGSAFYYGGYVAMFRWILENHRGWWESLGYLPVQSHIVMYDAVFTINITVMHPCKFLPGNFSIHMTKEPWRLSRDHRTAVKYSISILYQLIYKVRITWKAYTTVSQCHDLYIFVSVNPTMAQKHWKDLTKKQGCRNSQIITTNTTLQNITQLLNQMPRNKAFYHLSNVTE